MAKKSGRSAKPGRKAARAVREPASRKARRERVEDRAARPMDGSITDAVRTRVQADQEAMLSGQPLALWV